MRVRCRHQPFGGRNGEAIALASDGGSNKALHVFGSRTSQRKCCGWGRLEQVRTWSIDRKGDRQPLFATLLEGTVTDAVQARHALARLTGRARKRKSALALRKAKVATPRLSTAADLLVASWLASGDDNKSRAKASDRVGTGDLLHGRTPNGTHLRVQAALELRDVVPFHWACEFPDVFIEGHGFDAVVGNPPYVRQEILSPIKPLLKSVHCV